MSAVTLETLRADFEAALDRALVLRPMGSGIWATDPAASLSAESYIASFDDAYNDVSGCRSFMANRIGPYGTTYDDLLARSLCAKAVSETLKPQLRYNPLKASRA